MQRHSLFSFFLLIGLASGVLAQQTREISVDEYVDKMKAGWVGQMVGVGWGGPTEFKIRGKIMPAEMVPKWQPRMVNQFRQDDIYVEMTFLQTLENHGLDCTIRQAGIDFANSGYRLWHANRYGRENLRCGIAPPDSGHPQFNGHADDIDYQIEADYSGLIAPGMPQLVIELGEKFGRLMNYGDGTYAGQFVGGMYAEAFFEDDIVKIVEAGLKCIPSESQYAEMIRDMLAWYEKNPDDWEKTWQWCEEKYHKSPDYTHGKCSGHGGDGAFSIDAKLNGAYILMGLLYGKGDFDQTVIISTRCGQDSDCNPSNAAGILFTTIGFSKLPERFTSELDPTGKFSHTPYDFPKLIDVSTTLVRQAVERSGGSVRKSGEGQEIFVIPVVAPKPSKFEPVYNPGPIANSRFSEEEMEQIKVEGAPKPANLGEMPALVEKFAPGWKIRDCGPDMSPGLRNAYRGRKNVLITHPLKEGHGCTLYRKISVPKDGKTLLKLVVGHDTRGDWTLVAKVAGTELVNQKIGPKTVEDGWATITIDLGDFAGTDVDVELINQPNGWSWEAGCWGEISLVTE